MITRILPAIALVLLCTSGVRAQTVTQERQAYYDRVLEAESDWGGDNLASGTWRVIDWQLEPDAQAYFTYLNSERFTVLGNQRYRTWIKIVRKQDNVTSYGKAFRSTVRQLDVDCVRRRIRHGPSALYDQNGRVVDSVDSWSEDWSETLPDSQGELWVKEICSYARNRR